MAQVQPCVPVSGRQHGAPRTHHGTKEGRVDGTQVRHFSSARVQLNDVELETRKQGTVPSGDRMGGGDERMTKHASKLDPPCLRA